MESPPSVNNPPWYRALLRWVDSEASDRDQFLERHSVEWLRVIPFGLVHLACAAVFWVGWSPLAVGVAFSAYCVRMFAITGFYHRYFSHRTFKTSRPIQFFFAVLGNSALQRGPLWWAAHHRQHHRYADQDNDPHSPHRHGFVWSHILWITSRKNFPTNMPAVRDLSRFPELRFLNRFDFLVPILLACGMYLLGEQLIPYGTNGWQMLIWGFFVSTIVLFHATCTINSLSHQFGSRRFQTNEESRNNPLLALITFGEGWHNNHHFCPSACRQGFYWWEIDLTFIGLKSLSFLGIIWDLNPVPDRVYQRAKEIA
ncbi:MAG: acyl-CoA desaturase [Candidatus Latescibacterota bacterium]|nr:acyl-CoA desaturase [Candidatus Latescibacterota bacterium]